MRPRLPPERFFGTALRVLAPVLVWALHFAFSYVLVAWGCVAWGAQAPLRGALLAAGGAALAVVAALVARAWRRPDGELATPATRWTAALAVLGIAWTALPALFLPVCGP